MIQSFEYVLIMTLAQLPGYYSAAWLIERMGRKFVLVTYLLGTAASALVFGAAESTTILIVSGILLSFFNLGAWGALYAYSPEQYPAVIRGTGSGMSAAIGRVGGILGPLLVGSLVSAGYSISYIFTHILYKYCYWGNSRCLLWKRNPTNRTIIKKGHVPCCTCPFL